jgi:hypothetical protein
VNAPTDADPRAELARRLDVLYSDAGSPPLKAVSARARAVFGDQLAKTLGTCAAGAIVDTSSAGELLVLLDSSGARKSPLLQAGFAARIRDDVDVLLVTPTAVPAGHLDAWIRDRAVESKPYVLAVDQLEEIFVAPFDDAAAGAYLTKLDELCAPGSAGPGECGPISATRAACVLDQAARLIATLSRSPPKR